MDDLAIKEEESPNVPSIHSGIRSFVIVELLFFLPSGIIAYAFFYCKMHFRL